MQEICLFTKIAQINIRLPLVQLFFMFGTSYVDAVKGRKLLTFCRVVDGLMDVQELGIAGDFGR